MPLFAVASVLFLFVNALGHTLWWRQPNAPWYGSAAFAWGIFSLAMYVTWPTLKTLF
jgi:hypothetical protein